MQLFSGDLCIAFFVAYGVTLFFAVRGIRIGLLMRKEGSSKWHVAHHKRCWKFAYVSLAVALMCVVAWTEIDLDAAAISARLHAWVGVLAVVFGGASWANRRFNGERAPFVHTALNITIGTTFVILSVLGVVMLQQAAHLTVPITL